MKPQMEFRQDLLQVLRSLRRGNLRVHIAPVDALWRPQPHAHFHPTSEFFIQTGGATDFKCPGGSFRMHSGEVCIMPAGVPHAETPRDIGSPYGILVCMHQHNGLFLHRGKADPVRRIQGYGTMLIPGERVRDAMRYMDDIVHGPDLPAKERRRYADSLIEAFILTILGELSCIKPIPSDVPPLVAEAEKLMRSRLGNPNLSIAGLAKDLGCSPNHLSCCFHKEQGITLSTWIQKERVISAQRLLKEMKYNIDEIGWACGFTSASYFIRVFRKHTGLTPLTFRKKALQ